MADKTLPPIAIGDSLAQGMRDANQLAGISRVGAGPKEVYGMLERYAAENSLSGRDVFLGTGMPNIPEQKKFIEQQIDFVKKQGGNPILMGVGPGTKAKPTTGQNEFLSGLAERKGLKYMGPLANQFPDVVKDPMGLHLRPKQYQQLFKQFSQPQPTQPQTQQVQPQSRAPSAADLLGQFTGAVMQAESQGKRYDKEGRLLTSKAGAKGEMQVMPGTVRDPGFGVRPARDNSPDEIARVGRDYAAVMLRRYNNDPTAAAVAYNWGPGNADKWIKRGADFEALPKETKNYVTRITGQMGVPIAAKRVPPPAKRVETRPVPPQKRAEAGEDYETGSTLELASRPADQGPAQITREDVDRMGPNYQAALAAMTLGDSREEDDDYDDEETIAERYMERREMQLAEDDSTLEEEPTRTSPLAGLSEISYQSPFPEVQPVMMARGGLVYRADGSPMEGEVKSVSKPPVTALLGNTYTYNDYLDSLEPTFGQKMGVALSDIGTKGLIHMYDAARLAEGALSSKESAAEKEQKMSAAHKIYLDTFGFRNRRDPITKEYFNQKEQNAILDLIRRKKSNKGSIQYKDYDGVHRVAEEDKVLSGQLDPYLSVNKSLGQFNYEYDPKKGVYRITDEYDFNPVRESGVSGRMITSDTMGDYLSDVPSFYGKARIYGGRHMPPGTGRKVDFTLSPPKFIGRSPAPVKRADGSPVYGEMADTGGITEDTRRALGNRQSFDPREALAALKRIGTEGVSNLESLARGSVAGVPGVVGDIESLFRDSDKTRRFATSEEVERQYLPKRMTAPTKESQGFVEIGTAIDPSIALKAAPKTAKAALKALKESGPQVEAALMKAAPAAQPMNIIKYEGGNWMPTRERSDVVNDYVANLMKDTGVGNEIKYKKRAVDMYQDILDKDKATVKVYKDSVKKVYQNTSLAKADRPKKISLAQKWKVGAREQEQFLAQSQRILDEAQAELARPQSIANFIENKLQPYIRNNLGTPSDQVRLRMDKWELEEQPKLIAEKQKQIDKVRADIERAAAARGDINPLTLTRSQEQLRKLLNEKEGIKSRTGSFFQMGQGEREAMLRRYDMVRGSNPRGEIGTVNFPATPTVAKSGLGKIWEETVDFSVDAYKPSEAASEYASIYGKEPPAWLTKAAESGDNKGIYSLDYRPGGTLPYQFRHMIDELKSSVDPQTNLPKELRRTPKEIEKMSVDDAAALVDKINGWRASNTTGLDLARANSPAVAEVKTYKTVPNTNIPNEKNLRWVEIKMPEGMDAKEGKKILADALEYEGEIMKHCVGTYCPDVQEGTKIFSLRDDMGRPYTTIEAVPDMDFVDDIIDEEFKKQGHWQYAPDKEKINMLRDELGYEIPYEIKQIKGERNGAPIEEVIPFVRDFVSDPKWTDVANINLIGGL